METVDRIIKDRLDAMLKWQGNYTYYLFGPYQERRQEYAALSLSNRDQIRDEFHRDYIHMAKALRLLLQAEQEATDDGNFELLVEATEVAKTALTMAGLYED